MQIRKIFSGSGSNPFTFKSFYSTLKVENCEIKNETYYPHKVFWIRKDPDGNPKIVIFHEFQESVLRSNRENCCKFLVTALTLTEANKTQQALPWCFKPPSA
jgi:hypothetical protein